MQRDNHVYVPVSQRIPRYIRDLEAQSLIAVFGCQSVAALHHVGLQVIARNVRAHSLFHRKVIIQYEGQIRLAAAEVKYAYLLLTIPGKGLVHEFDEAFYLPVLAVF